MHLNTSSNQILPIMSENTSESSLPFNSSENEAAGRISSRRRESLACIKVGPETCLFRSASPKVCMTCSESGMLSHQAAM